jgi:hypothetical protein
MGPVASSLLAALSRSDSRQLWRPEMATPKAPTKIVRRDSEDGRFVKKSYVDTHPKTTETERVRIPVRRSQPPKK